MEYIDNHNNIWVYHQDMTTVKESKKNRLMIVEAGPIIWIKYGIAPLEGVHEVVLAGWKTGKVLECQPFETRNPTWRNRIMRPARKFAIDGTNLYAITMEDFLKAYPIYEKR